MNRALCEAVKKLIANIYSGSASSSAPGQDGIDPEIEASCGRMQEKLSLLLSTLENFESTSEIPSSPLNNGAPTPQDPNNIILQRANSLEKALSAVMTSRRAKKVASVNGSRMNGWSSTDLDPNIPGGCNNRSAKRAFSYKNAITSSSSHYGGEVEEDYGDSETSEECPGHLLRNPTIEIESPSSSSSPVKRQETDYEHDVHDLELSETDLELDISLGMEQELLGGEQDDGGIGTGSNSNATLDESPSPGAARSLVVPRKLAVA